MVIYRIILGTDSGKIVILEYLPEKRQFVKTHEETFGKSGCRRIVPCKFILIRSPTYSSRSPWARSYDCSHIETKICLRPRSIIRQNNHTFSKRSTQIPYNMHGRGGIGCGRWKCHVCLFINWLWRNWR